MGPDPPTVRAPRGLFANGFDGLALSSETGVEPESDREEESVYVKDWIFTEVAEDVRCVPLAGSDNEGITIRVGP